MPRRPDPGGVFSLQCPDATSCLSLRSLLTFSSVFTPSSPFLPAEASRNTLPAPSAQPSQAYTAVARRMLASRVWSRSASPSSPASPHALTSAAAAAARSLLRRSGMQASPGPAERPYAGLADTGDRTADAPPPPCSSSGDSR
jgi:hypothetical protein